MEETKKLENGESVEKETKNKKEKRLIDVTKIGYKEPTVINMELDDSILSKNTVDTFSVTNHIIKWLWNRDKKVNLKQLQNYLFHAQVSYMLRHGIKNLLIPSRIFHRDDGVMINEIDEVYSQFNDNITELAHQKLNGNEKSIRCKNRLKQDTFILKDRKKIEFLDKFMNSATQYTFEDLVQLEKDLFNDMYGEVDFFKVEYDNQDLYNHLLNNYNDEKLIVS